MDLESQPLKQSTTFSSDKDEDEEDKREVHLHGTNVTWKSGSSVSQEQRKEPSNQLTSTTVNRSNKVSPFLGGFVNPLANATTPLKKNISPSNYHSGYASDSSSSTGSSNSLNDSLFPKTASWRIMSISGRRPSNVKILSMDDSGSWRVLSQKKSTKSQPSFPMVVCIMKSHLFLSSPFFLFFSYIFFVIIFNTPTKYPIS